MGLERQAGDIQRAPIPAGHAATNEVKDGAFKPTERAARVADSVEESSRQNRFWQVQPEDRDRARVRVAVMANEIGPLRAAALPLPCGTLCSSSNE
jgi:hypothetical protein